MYKSLTFEPEQWPEDSSAEGSNCYSYALDDKDYHWAIPGYGFFSGITYQQYEKKFDDYFTMRPREFRRAMVDGAVRDGLQRVVQANRTQRVFSPGFVLSDKQRRITMTFTGTVKMIVAGGPRNAVQLKHEKWTMRATLSTIQNRLVIHITNFTVSFLSLGK